MEYGICRLSIVPVRTEASEKSELCTQLLFGEAYVVQQYSEDKKWMNIQTVFDQYSGWINAIQHSSLSESYYQAYVNTPHRVCAGFINVVILDDVEFAILPGSLLPFYKDSKCTIEENEYI